MSDEPPRDAPPAGEQVHVPERSWLPVLLALGVMVALVGVTTGIVLVVAGLVLALPVLVIWVRSARDELGELPPGH